MTRRGDDDGDAVAHGRSPFSRRVMMPVEECTDLGTSGNQFFRLLSAYLKYADSDN
jgi:hypothetical protein